MSSPFNHDEQIVDYVLFDWQDGNGWQDVSHVVKWDSIEVQEQAMNQNYRFVQNSANFTLIYDETVYNKLIAQTKDVLVRIQTKGSLEDYKNLVGVARVGTTYLTNGSYAFTGRFKPYRNRTYNGIVNNMMIPINATDSSRMMDKEVGDIIYENYKICDQANTAQSILHQLTVLSGLPITKVNPLLQIDVTVPIFAPAKPTQLIKKLLDDLLFEYGYTLTFDAYDRVHAYNWLGDTTPIFTFDDTNMKLQTEVAYQDKDQEYKGVAVKYYGYGTKESILLYRDNDMPYGDTIGFEFTGFPVQGATKYPLQTNADDPATGLPYVVKQKYTDDGIKYFTNSIVESGRQNQYYYKAFQSDFSDIIKTENHTLNYRADTEITVVSTDFGNKEAEVIFQNTLPASDPVSTNTRNIYYFNIYGDVTYRTSERVRRKDIFDDATEYKEYTLAHVFDDVAGNAHIENLIERLASDMAIQRVTYKVTASRDIGVGRIVHISMGDGTEQDCVVLSRSYREADGKYVYELMGIGEETQADGTSSVNVAPPIAGGSTETHVPRYVGAYDSDALALSGSTPPMRPGDWYLYSGTTGGGRTKGGVYRWTNTQSDGTAVFTQVVTKEYVSPAIEDAMALADVSAETIQIAEDFADSVILNKLFVNRLGAQAVTVKSATSGPYVEISSTSPEALKVNDGTNNVLRAFTGTSGNFGTGDIVLGTPTGSTTPSVFTAESGIFWDQSRRNMQLLGVLGTPDVRDATMSISPGSGLIDPLGIRLPTGAFIVTFAVAAGVTPQYSLYFVVRENYLGSPLISFDYVAGISINSFLLSYKDTNNVSQLWFENGRSYRLASAKYIQIS